MAAIRFGLVSLLCRAKVRSISPRQGTCIYSSLCALLRIQSQSAATQLAERSWIWIRCMMGRVLLFAGWRAAGCLGGARLLTPAGSGAASA
jgi:hypothetical protein